MLSLDLLWGWGLVDEGEEGSWEVVEREEIF